MSFLLLLFEHAKCLRRETNDAALECLCVHIHECGSRVSYTDNSALWLVTSVILLLIVVLWMLLLKMMKKNLVCLVQTWSFRKEGKRQTNWDYKHWICSRFWFRFHPWVPHVLLVGNTSTFCCAICLFRHSRNTHLAWHARVWVEIEWNTCW